MASKKTDQAILRNGKNGNFWNVILKALDSDIKQLKAREDSGDFDNMPADQYKLEIKLLKEERKHLEKLKVLPDRLIEDLESPPSPDPDLDPYHRPEDF